MRARAISRIVNEEDVIIGRLPMISIVGFLAHFYHTKNRIGQNKYARCGCCIFFFSSLEKLGTKKICLKQNNIVYLQPKRNAMYSNYKPSGEKELSETLQTMEMWETSDCLYGVRQMLTDPTGRRTTPGTILYVRKVWRDRFVLKWNILAPRESDILIEQACKELDFVRKQRFFHIKPYMFNSMQVLAILRWLETRFTDKSGIWTYVSVDLKKCALNSDFFK